MYGGQMTKGTTQAHPRRCGEHRSFRCSADMPCGSSPQVRGTSQGRVDGAALGRLIPAGAGNIVYSHRNIPHLRAHPRRCGEHLESSDLYAPEGGSSPQVRGTLHGRELADGLTGLIPAGAGNIP